MTHKWKSTEAILIPHCGIAINSQLYNVKLIHISETSDCDLIFRCPRDMNELLSDEVMITSHLDIK